MKNSIIAPFLKLVSYVGGITLLFLLFSVPARAEQRLKISIT